MLEDCGEEDGVIVEEGEEGRGVVLRKKKPHLPSSRERNRNSGILSIVQVCLMQAPFFSITTREVGRGPIIRDDAFFHEPTVRFYQPL